MPAFWLPYSSYRVKCAASDGWWAQRDFVHGQMCTCAERETRAPADAAVESSLPASAMLGRMRGNSASTNRVYLRVIAAMATSDPRIDVNAVAAETQSRF